MVYFTCALTGEQIKKPKMEKHLARYPNANKFICIDYLQEFDRITYKSHNKCMTVNERYGGKDYVEKTSKGEGKQRAWIAMITKVMEEATLSPSASRMWNQLENGGFENIPRKKAKFFNFIQNSMRTGDKKTIEEIWCVFETSFNQQREGQQQVKKTPKKEPMKFDSSRPWYEQLNTGKSGSTKSDSSSSSSSDEEEKKPSPEKKKKLTKKVKKESSESEEEPPKKIEKKSPPKKVAKKKSSSESSSSDEEEEKVPQKPVVKAPAKKESSSSDSSSEDEEPAKPVKNPIVKKPVKKESSSSSDSSSEEEQKPKVVAKKPVAKAPVKKESSSSESSSEEEEPAKPVKKPIVKQPVKKE